MRCARRYTISRVNFPLQAAETLNHPDSHGKFEDHALEQQAVLAVQPIAVILRHCFDYTQNNAPIRAHNSKNCLMFIIRHVIARITTGA